MEHERNVAGLSCSEVLAQLSAYLDEELDAAARSQIDAHLKGCDTCERFGGRFGAVVGGLRRNLGVAPPLAPDRLQQIWRQVNAKLDEE